MKISNLFAAGRLFSIAVLFVLAACDSETNEPSATENALEELQAKYDELTGNSLDDPAKWAAEDLENIGDWEYLVREIPFSSPGELELALNKLGDDRWEVFWIERTETGLLVVLKKPAVSYLSKIPLSQIGRFVIGDPDSAE